MEIFLAFAFFEIAAMFAGYLIGRKVGESERASYNADDTRIYFPSRDRRRCGDNGHDMEDKG